MTTICQIYEELDLMLKDDSSTMYIIGDTAE